LLSGKGLPFVILIGLPSLLILFSSLVTRFYAREYSNSSSGSPARANYSKAFYVSIFGLLLAGAIFVDEFEHYSCLTPTNIVVRSGYFDTPHNLTWNELKSVRAWCWTARGGYLGGTLTLSLLDGENIPIGLGSGHRILMSNYKMIRQTLSNKNYIYYADPSVNSGSCPPELYPLLKNWEN
jgi:hypothetical protein